MNADTLTDYCDCPEDNDAFCPHDADEVIDLAATLGIVAQEELSDIADAELLSEEAIDRLRALLNEAQKFILAGRTY